MILVYSLLSENRDLILNSLLSRVRSHSRCYAKVPKFELKECFSAIYEGYLDLLASGEIDRLKTPLSYFIKARQKEGFQLGEYLKSVWLLGSVARSFLQEAYRQKPEASAQNFNQAMKSIEESLLRTADLLIELHEQRELDGKPKKALRLSQLMVFRG